MEKQVVGILVNHSWFKGIPFGRTRHEKINFYEKAGNVYGITPCYFRLKDISLTQHKVEAYVLQNNKYVLVSMNIPKWIHNRGMYFKKASRMKLVELEKSGHFIFNRRTRFKKLLVHHILMKNPMLHEHMPDTKLATFKNLRIMMKKHNVLIIKPNSGSIGLGIMQLEKKGIRWKISYPKSKNQKKKRFQYFRERIPPLLKQKLKTRRYIIQQRIPLMTYNQRPYDLRVSVQKDETGQWQVTGMVAKLAAKHKFVTNVAQGGTVYPFELMVSEHPAFHFDDIKSKVQDVSLQIVNHLDNHIDGLADLGLDIGIHKDGRPMFIECNARDLRYSFKEGHLLDQWKATYEKPIAYASSLIRNQKKHPLKY